MLPEIHEVNEIDKNIKKFSIGEIRHKQLGNLANNML